MTPDLTPTPSPAADRVFCANHPDRETTLRCNKCGKPICVKCARRTPIGYRCKECVNQHQQLFETAQWYDLVIAFALSTALSAVGGALVTALGWFVIFLSPMAGGVIAEVIFRVMRKRRSRYLPWIAAGGAALGGLALCALPMLALVAGLFVGEGSFANFGFLFGLIWPVVYVALCASTVYYRMRGIGIN